MFKCVYSDIITHRNYYYYSVPRVLAFSILDIVAFDGRVESVVILTCFRFLCILLKRGLR